MTLNFQLQQAPFAFGLAEGVDPHQAPFGTLMTAENARWGRNGRIQKRRGYTMLTSLGLTSLRLGVKGNELLAFAPGGAGVFGITSTNGAWVNRGNFPDLSATTRSVRDDTAGISAADMTVLNDGTTVHAWLTGASTADSSVNINIQVTDPRGAPVRLTGTVSVIVSANPSTTRRIRMVSDGTTWGVVALTSTTGIWIVQGTATTISTQVNLVPGGSVDTGTYAPLDAFVNAGRLYVAYNDNNIKVAIQQFLYANVAAGATNAILVSAATNAQSLSIDGAYADYVHVVSVFSTSVTYAALNGTSLAVTVAPTNIDTMSAILSSGNLCGIVRASATSAYVAWSYSQASNTNAYADGVARSALLTVSGATATASGALDSAAQMLLSKPFIVGGVPYMAVTNNPYAPVTGTNVQSGYSGADINIVGLTTLTYTSLFGAVHRVSSKVDTLTGGFWKIAQTSAPAVVGNKVLMACPYLSGIQQSGNYAATTVRQSLHELTLTNDGSNATDFLRSVAIGPELYVASGVVSAYDGVECLPVNASHPTYQLSASPSTTGGTLAAGNYIYGGYLERRSASGILHRGPTNIPITVATTGTTGSVLLRYVPVWLSVSSTQALGSVAIYRSIVGGNTLQKLTNEPGYAYLPNTYSSTTSILSFTDTASDSAAGLAKRPAIYTASGELDDYQPPGALTIAEHQNRVWIVAPDGMTLWFSKDPTLNPGVAPGFNPSLTIPFEVPIVALRTLDSALVAFTSTGMFVIQGDGPAPNGQGATYQAVKVQTDVGCIAPRSVVSTPMGLMFQSTRGIYLLSRGLEVQFVGGPVQTRSQNATVTSAVLVARHGEVRFSMSTGESLVFNYLYSQWSTTKYTVGGVYGAVIVDALMWNGSYTFLTTSGAIGQENEAGYLDGTSYVPMTLETTWNNAAGPLAYQSVRNFSIEGFSNTDHDLTIACGFDNNPTYQQSVTFVAGTPVTAIGPLESCDVSIGTRRKCQSIRFKISDATPSGAFPVGTGQGPSFDSVGVEVGIKQGFRAKPIGKTG